MMSVYPISEIVPARVICTLLMRPPLTTEPMSLLKSISALRDERDFAEYALTVSMPSMFSMKYDDTCAFCSICSSLFCLSLRLNDSTTHAYAAAVRMLKTRSLPLCM